VAEVDEALELADWRRRTVELYLAEPLAGRAGAEAWRRGRDELLKGHPQSPVPAAGRATYQGAPYWPWDQRAVVEAGLEPAGGDAELEVDTGGPDGVLRYRRLARLATPWGELTLFWLAAYGGGRYLTDTVKGTHGRGLVQTGPGRVRLDFNYAYNPSCAYDPGWACPLAPPENHLDGAVEAGERHD